MSRGGRNTLGADSVLGSGTCVLMPKEKSDETSQEELRRAVQSSRCSDRKRGN